MATRPILFFKSDFSLAPDNEMSIWCFTLFVLIFIVEPDFRRRSEIVTASQ